MTHACVGKWSDLDAHFVTFIPMLTNEFTSRLEVQVAVIITWQDV